MIRLISTICLAFLFLAMPGGAGAITQSLASHPGSAQKPTCMAREELTNALVERYDEQVRALGAVGDTVIMELYVSKDGTWTVVLTNTQGISCVMAAGDRWDLLPMSSVLEGDPT